MGALNLFPLGEPSRHDVESAAKLYLEYDRKGLLDDDLASMFAMQVDDCDAVYDRAAELKREEKRAARARVPVTS